MRIFPWGEPFWLYKHMTKRKVLIPCLILSPHFTLSHFRLRATSWPFVRTPKPRLIMELKLSTNHPLFLEMLLLVALAMSLRLEASTWWTPLNWPHWPMKFLLPWPSKACDCIVVVGDNKRKINSGLSFCSFFPHLHPSSFLFILN